MSKIKFWDLFFLFPLLGAFLFILQAVNEKSRITQIKSNGAHVMGVVKRIKLKADTDKDWTEYEIEYRDTSGNKYMVSNHFSTNDMRYHIGDSVNVIYKATDPQEAYIDSSAERNYPFTIGLVAGFACISFSAFFHFYLRHKFFPNIPAEDNEIAPTYPSGH